MSTSVIGISGSPHRHGNTETLLDSFLAGAEAAGATVEKVILRSLDYTSCRGCNACHKTGTCVVQDALTPLFERIVAADCLALASPIYTMGITAEMKGFLDRGQALWAQKYILRMLEHSRGHLACHTGIFISTAGQGSEQVFDAAIPAMKAFFGTLGFEYSANILANDMDRYKGIRGHPTALADAFRKGGEVVKILANCSQ
jgi:multimeric flavodoxin WrbA